MARYDAAHKQHTRQRIVASAGKIFRSSGYAASGLAGIMGAAGLTVGGFYAHFASKEALLIEVLSETLAAGQRRLATGLEAASGNDFVRALVERYLSRVHCDHPEHGCPLPSLAVELGRQSDDTRADFEALLLKALRGYEARLPEPGESGLSQRDHALALLALLVGGVILARAVKSPSLSNRVLRACKRFALAAGQ